eukprot:TRINITY_DN54474_c0_g1_i1.p1 TRINITY_DN54474_c0_g1~~TRINITY_DN54474_c0_g1_i1.p1  ORF type:complete len:620 (-),score=176.81 TRINITY_DN54474_c0_g1_i1:8-1867(-)
MSSPPYHSSAAYVPSASRSRTRDGEASGPIPLEQAAIERHRLGDAPHSTALAPGVKTTRVAARDPGQRDAMVVPAVPAVHAAHTYHRGGAAPVPLEQAAIERHRLGDVPHSTAALAPGVKTTRVATRDPVPHNAMVVPAMPSVHAIQTYQGGDVVPVPLEQAALVRQRVAAPPAPVSKATIATIQNNMFRGVPDQIEIDHGKFNFFKNVDAGIAEGNRRIAEESQRQLQMVEKEKHAKKNQYFAQLDQAANHLVQGMGRLHPGQVQAMAEGQGLRDPAAIDMEKEHFSNSLDEQLRSGKALIDQQAQQHKVQYQQEVQQRKVAYAQNLDKLSHEMKGKIDLAAQQQRIQLHQSAFQMKAMMLNFQTPVETAGIPQHPEVDKQRMKWAQGMEAQMNEGMRLIDVQAQQQLDALPVILQEHGQAHSRQLDAVTVEIFNRIDQLARHQHVQLTQAIYHWKSMLEEQAFALKQAYLERKMQGQLLSVGGQMQNQYLAQLQDAVSWQKKWYSEQLDSASAGVKTQLQHFEAEQRTQLQQAATQLRCIMEQQSAALSVDYLQRQMQAKLVQNVAETAERNAAVAAATQVEKFQVAQRVQQHNAGLQQGKQWLAQGYPEASLFHNR